MMKESENIKDQKENTSSFSNEELKKPEVKRFSVNLLWEQIVRLGLGEMALRISSGVLTLVLILIIVWVMGNFYLYKEEASPETGGNTVVLPTQVSEVHSPPLNLPYAGAYLEGVIRLANVHTNIPDKPRMAVFEYEVETGDSIYGIAEKFNLKPETILWGNYYTLFDDPHRLSPGQILNILPINGVYYEWHAGDGLNGVAEYFGSSPEDIINFEGNNLDSATIGEYVNPNIEPGSWLVIPGGAREFITWSAPRISRDEPAVAKLLGPGSCEGSFDGPVGNGTFVWPAIEKFLSGFDYSPETNHYGIDISGNTGDAIYASDNGVVVYSGWNDYGYGYTIVVDHGYGWQTLYAHLSALNTVCGMHVFQGDVIGAMGNTGNSTGSHLHFEMRGDAGRVNPWNFLIY
ncbi:MAG: peptidoglycan DD-metalloendopeptidase family protein [Anaerolineaceae bacterium]|nr:peptidoglycan DD-metalloendopeptidase family protein [Anaerolineaceae bacterium]